MRSTEICPTDEQNFAKAKNYKPQQNTFVCLEKVLLIDVNHSVIQGMRKRMGRLYYTS
jgi:hypothetical protein